MLRKIFIFLVVVLLCGCDDKFVEYKEVSDIAMDLLKDNSYNKTNLNSKQIGLIDDYLYDLENPEINVSELIIYKNNYKVNEANSSGIYMKKNACYIRYNDIIFEKAIDEAGEDMARVVCNGYVVVIYDETIKSNFINSDDNYRYLGYFYKNGYNFAYRSYYDGNGVIVSINDKITIKEADVDNLKLKNFNNVSYKKYIVSSVIAFILLCMVMFLKKKYIEHI